MLIKKENERQNYHDVFLNVVMTNDKLDSIHVKH